MWLLTWLIIWVVNLNIDKPDEQYTFTVEFTKEEFNLVKFGMLGNSSFNSFLWQSELESILLDSETYYMSELVEVKLSQNKGDLLEKVIDEFLKLATVD